MSFQPVIIGTGLAGWGFLKKTLSLQKANHASTHQVQTNGAHFKTRFPDLTTPDAIVSDRRVLSVILGAYGLADDVGNKYFIKRILTEGVANDNALANKLSDYRYREMAKDFDFSRTPPSHLSMDNLAEKVVKAYERNLFEVAIGASDVNLRLALGFGRELSKLADSETSNKAMWYRVLGSPPLRQVFETALSLPSDIGKLDIDVQLDLMMQKSRKIFGTSQIHELALEPKSEGIAQNFILKTQLATTVSTNRFSTALALLSSGSGARRTRY